MKKIAAIFLIICLFVVESKINTALAQAPTITSFSPTNSKPGDVVTITGTNFNTTVANNVVFEKL